MKRFSILVEYRRASGALADAHFVEFDVEDSRQAQAQAMQRAHCVGLKGPLRVVRCNEVAA